MWNILLTDVTENIFTPQRENTVIRQPASVHKTGSQTQFGITEILQMFCINLMVKGNSFIQTAV